MWFSVAVEWKYALRGFRSQSTGGDRITIAHLNSLSGSGVRSSGLKLKKGKREEYI